MNELLEKAYKIYDNARYFMKILLDSGIVDKDISIESAMNICEYKMEELNRGQNYKSKNSDGRTTH